MNKNIGSTDRLFRIFLGVIILAAGFYFQSYWGAIGLIPLLTALVGWCPIYAPFKISTRKSEA